VVDYEEPNLRIEVIDVSLDLPVMVNPPADSETGRGLIIIDALATTWMAKPSAAARPFAANWHHPNKLATGINAAACVDARLNNVDAFAEKELSSILNEDRGAPSKE
jgi:hypothetical protein